MKKLFLLGLLACAFAGNPEQAEAKSANVLNFQGTIKDAQEQVVNRSMKMTFKIYDTQTGGTALWTEDNQVTVKDGFFNVYLGTLQDLELNFAKELYIEVTLDNGDVLPRTRLTASPFAINAGTASEADTANVAKSVVDGVLTWSNFKADALKVDGLIKGTFPNNLTIDWDNVEKFSIPSDRIAGGPMLHVTATPGGKAGGDMTGTFPNPRLKNEVVENRHIAPNAVTTDKIKDGEVMNADLAENAVTTDKIKNGEVMTDDIADKNVTLPKLAVGEANQVMVTDAAGKEAAWSNDLALPGNLTVKGTTTLEGKLTAKAGAEVTGDATFANDVTVTGKTTTGTLEAGATTLGATNMASAEVAGLTKTGTLEAGATTLGATTTGTLNATGDATFANNVTVTGKTTTGTLEAGATTLGATTMASADVTGDFAAKGNSVLGTDNTNTITVNGKLAPAAGGTVTANALDGVVVNTANIADGAVTNEKIADATINIAKLAKAAGEAADAGKVLVLDINGIPTYANLKNGLNQAPVADTKGQVYFWNGTKWAVSKSVQPTEGQLLKYNATENILEWKDDGDLDLPVEKTVAAITKTGFNENSDLIKITKKDGKNGTIMNLNVENSNGKEAVKVISEGKLAHENGALSVSAKSTADISAVAKGFAVKHEIDAHSNKESMAADFTNIVKDVDDNVVSKGINVTTTNNSAKGTTVGVSAMATGGAKQVAVFATDDATLNPDKTAVVLAKGAGKDVLVVEGVGAADQNYVATFKASEGNRSVLIEGGDWNKNLKGKDADGLDVDNAALVVRATPKGAIPANVNTAITTVGDPFNGAEGKTAIKTYGDIWANSAIGGTTIVGRRQVVVGTETGKIVVLTPPTSPTAPATFDRDIQAPNVKATKNVEATEEIKAGTNITANGNANVKGNTTLGTDATSTLTVNATSTFEAPATFNAGVTVDAVTTNDLTVNNNATIGSGDGTDKLTVNAASEFQKAVTAKEAVTFEKDVTIASNPAGTKANLNLTEGDVALTKGDVTVADGNIKVATDKFTVDKNGNVATKGTITQENANANFIQQDGKGTKVHIGIDGAGTKNGYINLWADEKVDTNAGYALFEADATGAKVTNRIDATLAHQTGIGLVKAGPHTGYSVVGTGNADNNDGVALTYKGNNANEARILVNKAGTTVFSVDAEGDVTANALKAKEAATFKKNVTLNSGLPGTNANLNLIEGNVALTKGNVTVTVGNVAVTTGNVAVTTGNVTVEDGNIKVGTAGAEKFTVDKNGNTDIKGNLNAGTTTLASATVTGNATVGGSLEVTGTTTLTGATTLTGELNANGGIKVDGDKFTVSVAGAVEAKGNVKAPTFEGELDGNAATATLADKATNLANGAKFRIPYQSAPNTTEFIAVPDPGGNQVLMYKAASGGSFVWEAIPVDLTANDLVTKINTATNTIDAERLNPAVVLETEVPSVIKDIKGNFAAGLEIEDLKVVTAKIGTKAVTTDKIDDDAVTSAKIANGTIDFVDLKAGAVVEAKIADGAVTPAKIAKGTSNQVLVTNAAGTAVEWATKVNAAATADVATRAGHVEGGAAKQLVYQSNTNTTGFITAPSAANDVLTYDGATFAWVAKVNAAATADVATTANAVAADAILTGMIKDGEVQTNDIKDGSVTLTKIAKGTSSHVLVTNAGGTAVEWAEKVEKAKLADKASTVEANAIDAAALAANAVTSAKIFDGTITADDLGTASVATDELADGAVTSAKIFDGTIIAADIANDAVTSNKLATDAVTSAKIADGTITVADLANDAVTSIKLATNAVTTAKIVDKNVAAAKILGGTVGQVLVSGASNEASWSTELTGLTNLTATGAVNLGETDGTVNLSKLGSTTAVKGALTVAEATTLAKKLTVSTGGLEVTAGGATITAGDVSVVAGNVTANADFTVNDAANSNTFEVGSRTINLGNEAADVVTVKGNLTVASDLAANGGITVDTDRFTVADATGNVATKGTLEVTGATTLKSTLAAEGNVTVGKNGTAANLEVNDGTISLKNASVEKFKVDATGAVTATSVTATTFNGALTGNATTATKLASGAANELVYQTGAGATGFLTAPTAAGQVLTWNGTNIAWAAPTNAQATAPVMTTANVTSAQIAGSTAPILFYTENTAITNAELGNKAVGTMITIVCQAAGTTDVLGKTINQNGSVTVISTGANTWAIISSSN